MSSPEPGRLFVARGINPRIRLAPNLAPTSAGCRFLGRLHCRTSGQSARRVALALRAKRPRSATIFLDAAASECHRTRPRIVNGRNFESSGRQSFLVLLNWFRFCTSRATSRPSTLAGSTTIQGRRLLPPHPPSKQIGPTNESQRLFARARTLSLRLGSRVATYRSNKQRLGSAETLL